MLKSKVIVLCTVALAIGFILARIMSRSQEARDYSLEINEVVARKLEQRARNKWLGDQEATQETRLQLHSVQLTLERLRKELERVKEERNGLLKANFDSNEQLLKTVKDFTNTVRDIEKTKETIASLEKDQITPLKRKIDELAISGAVKTGVHNRLSDESLRLQAKQPALADSNQALNEKLKNSQSQRASLNKVSGDFKENINQQNVFIKGLKDDIAKLDEVLEEVQKSIARAQLERVQAATAADKDVQEVKEVEKIKSRVPEKPAPSNAALKVAVAVRKEPATGEYEIGEEDVLGISVWENPDLSQDAIVRPDGKISLPLVGDIQAAGLTIPALDKEITVRLEEFIRDPQVSVSVQKIGGKKIILLGDVAGPGVYSLHEAKNVMGLIGLAGGFTRDAVPSSIILVRGGFVKAEARRLNLSKVFKGNLEDNVALEPGDIIFVPKKFIADLNYFLTQVIQPFAQGASVYTSATGYTGFTNRSRNSSSD